MVSILMGFHRWTCWSSARSWACILEVFGWGEMSAVNGCKYELDGVTPIYNIEKSFLISRSFVWLFARARKIIFEGCPKFFHVETNIFAKKIFRQTLAKSMFICSVTCCPTLVRKTLMWDILKLVHTLARASAWSWNFLAKFKGVSQSWRFSSFWVLSLGWHFAAMVATSLVSVSRVRPFVQPRPAIHCRFPMAAWSNLAANWNTGHFLTQKIGHLYLKPWMLQKPEVGTWMLERDERWHQELNPNKSNSQAVADQSILFLLVVPNSWEVFP